MLLLLGFEFTASTFFHQISEDPLGRGETRKVSHKVFSFFIAMDRTHQYMIIQLCSLMKAVDTLRRLKKKKIFIDVLMYRLVPLGPIAVLKIAGLFPRIMAEYLPLREGLAFFWTKIEVGL